VRLEYRPAKLNCTLEVKNLLNDFVLTDEEGQRHMLRDFVGYPLPGRTVMLTLHWRS